MPKMARKMPAKHLGAFTTTICISCLPFAARVGWITQYIAGAGKRFLFWAKNPQNQNPSHRDISSLRSSPQLPLFNIFYFVIHGSVAVIASLRDFALG